MNPDINPDYKKLYSIVKKLYGKTQHFRHGPYDETYYTLRTYESAKEIIKRLNRKCNKPLILVAAILHDVGKIKLKTDRIFAGSEEIAKSAREEWIKHPGLGISVAISILEKQGHSKEFIKKACYLIENHAKRKENIKKTLELKILQDADLVADSGMAGFIRPFLYSGKFNKYSIISSITYLKKEESRVANPKLLNLRVSREIAREKIKAEEALIKEISKDLNSDLLNKSPGT